jgi:hypothetical protein
MELDRRLSAQVGAMIAALKARGRVAADIDCSGVGELVFNNLDRLFLGFVRDESMSLAKLKSAAGEHHRLIARAIAN